MTPDGQSKVMAIAAAEPDIVGALAVQSESKYKSAKADEDKARDAREKAVAELKKLLSGQEGVSDEMASRLQYWTEKIATADADLHAAEDERKVAQASRDRIEQTMRLQAASKQAVSAQRRCITPVPPLEPQQR